MARLARKNILNTSPNHETQVTSIHERARRDWKEVFRAGDDATEEADPHVGQYCVDEWAAMIGAVTNIRGRRGNCNDANG